MINNYSNINSEELDSLFSLIGQSIWYLQNVEEALNTCITIKGDIKNIGSVSKIEGDNMLSKHRRNTLGTSLRIATKKNILSADLIKELKLFKEERDWLVHRSVYQNGDDLYHNEKRYELLFRIKSFINNALKLQKLISKELEAFVIQQGVSKEWIDNNARKIIQSKYEEKA